MPKQTIQALVEGGKATAAPPLGPALGPLGVNIGQVVADINKKTADFKGMQVPVKVTVDTETKQYSIELGTPPVSALIRKEAGVDKGASNPLAEKVGDLRIEQVIKIAKMKEDALLGKSTKERIKEVIGTCNSMGIMVEGKPAKEVINDINNGSFAEEIAKEKTDLTEQELKEIEEERKKLAAETERRRGEMIAKAKEILAKHEGKDSLYIKRKMIEQGIPAPIIKEVMPEEEKEEGEKLEKPEKSKKAARKGMKAAAKAEA